ncbi:2-hydroxyacid dehydrogenase [Novosphingobium sp.]|uniref:2-hydroxyacid dehydrogenase n=1 Tax=Novosphingobium sp. TaxID=1874826 RepID=UPI0025D10AE8|nr:2-hydroxyacid dehydrogenase [Novosphingobium sp.]
MKVAVFSAKDYDCDFLTAANASDGSRQELSFFETRLDHTTAALAKGAQAVCPFVNDSLQRHSLEALSHLGTRLVALRCAGFNNVDLVAAADLGIAVCRVPAYSPSAVAEHAVALILALNRKTHRAFARVREGNFALEGLLGFDLQGRTVGLIGTGRIGLVVARIMNGFGCKVIGLDPIERNEFRWLGGQYTDFAELLSDADIISLHCPLNPQTHHLINAAAVDRMKPGAMLINTSRGAVIDTKAVIYGLKCGKIGYLGLDVYEEEGDLFFEDLSSQVIQDDVFARLLTFPNALITGHQGFFTQEAMQAIAETTIGNINAFETVGMPLYPICLHANQGSGSYAPRPS